MYHQFIFYVTAKRGMQLDSLDSLDSFVGLDGGNASEDVR